jgi:hypothetical protein
MLILESPEYPESASFSDELIVMSNAGHSVRDFRARYTCWYCTLLPSASVAFAHGATVVAPVSPDAEDFRRGDTQSSSTKWRRHVG